MRLKSIFHSSIVILSLFVSINASAEEAVATLSVQESFELVMEAYENKNWKGLETQSALLIKDYPSTAFGLEARYFLGTAYFNLKEYEAANEQFSLYLKSQATPKHFEDAIQYKFSIAELYKAGEKKHLLGFESMPKWMPARQDAIKIYEEVIAALPHHELGAKALFGKAVVLFKQQEYKSSIETYQTLIRRFSKHQLAAESYVGIGEIYLTQCSQEYPDPDFLDLAQINLNKFKVDFPSDENIAHLETKLIGMKEVYAQSLYETAQFYERTKKPHASLIYYTQLIAKYPETKLAALSKKRQAVLEPVVKANKEKAAK